MRGVTKIALGVFLALFAVVTAGVTAAGAEGEAKIVLHVEGMR